MRTILYTLFILFLFVFLAGCNGQSDRQNTEISSTDYIRNKGSDTMVNLALAWAETYQNNHAGISISVTGGGSGTGIAALINGTVDIANASRKIKPEEEEEAIQQGYKAVEYIVARDAIAVIVSPTNPVDQLTLEQVSKIYRGDISNWSEVGGEVRPIVRLSRETNSGTHVYFLETVVRLGDGEDHTIFSPSTLLLPSSEGIIAEVEDNPNAIGYDGLGYITPEVKVIAIAKDDQSPYIIPSIETVNNNSYPIARELYMYTKGEPAGIYKDYLDWIFSPEAQEIVKELGFVPYQSTKDDNIYTLNSE